MTGCFYHKVDCNELKQEVENNCILLAFLLGPIGVMYASVISGIILLLVTIATAGTVIMPIAFWIGGWFVAMSAVDSHNDSIDAFKELMKPR